MYHDRSYRLLGTTAGEDTAVIRELHDLEQRLEQKLPKSMLEWYKRENAIAILQQHSNNDPLISVSDMQLVYWNSRTLLPIRHENQGVCTWAIELNRSDDPPVWVDVDTDGLDWKPCADTFSDYVFSCIWDHKSIFELPALVAAQNSSLSDATLERLTQYEQEILTHGFPGSTQYRFFDRTGAILIWSDDSQADWWVAAPTATQLCSMLRTIWHFDQLGGSLYACSDEGRVALATVTIPTNSD